MLYMITEITNRGNTIEYSMIPIYQGGEKTSKLQNISDKPIGNLGDVVIREQAKNIVTIEKAPNETTYHYDSMVVLNIKKESNTTYSLIGKKFGNIECKQSFLPASTPENPSNYFFRISVGDEVLVCNKDNFNKFIHEDSYYGCFSSQKGYMIVRNLTQEQKLKEMLLREKE